MDPGNRARQGALGAGRGYLGCHPSSKNRNCHLRAKLKCGSQATGLPSAPARDGRQPHDPTPGLGATWTDAPLSCLIAAWDGDAFRVRRAQRDIETVIPARSRRTNPQPHNPERSPARHAGERGLGWLKRRHRVASRYDPYA